MDRADDRWETRPVAGMRATHKNLGVSARILLRVSRRVIRRRVSKTVTGVQRGKYPYNFDIYIYAPLD